MSKFDKLLRKIYSLDKNMRFEELKKTLNTTDTKWKDHLEGAAINLSENLVKQQSLYLNTIQ